MLIQLPFIGVYPVVVVNIKAMFREVASLSKSLPVVKKQDGGNTEDCCDGGKDRGTNVCVKIGEQLTSEERECPEEDCSHEGRRSDGRGCINCIAIRKIASEYKIKLVCCKADED